MRARRPLMRNFKIVRICGSYRWLRFVHKLICIVRGSYRVLPGPQFGSLEINHRDEFVREFDSAVAHKRFASLLLLESEKEDQNRKFLTFSGGKKKDLHLDFCSCLNGYLTPTTTWEVDAGVTSQSQSLKASVTVQNLDWRTHCTQTSLQSTSHVSHVSRDLRWPSFCPGTPRRSLKFRLRLQETRTPFTPNLTFASRKIEPQRGRWIKARACCAQAWRWCNAPLLKFAPECHN